MDGSLGVNFEHIALSLRNGKTDGMLLWRIDLYLSRQTMDRAVNVGRS